MAAGERTEKATPKKKDDARKKGQVARSVDLNGAVVLMAGLLALSAMAPRAVEELQAATRHILALAADPSIVTADGLGPALMPLAGPVAFAALPVMVACTVAGVLVNLVQVGLKPSPGALKPQWNRLNPISGAKNLFGKRAIFEAGKGSVKVAAVGAIALLSVLPKLEELAALVGMPPAVLLPEIARAGLHVAQRAAMAYLVIAFADFAYQRWHFEKELRMDKQEVKDEFKQQALPAEVRMAQRRRAQQLANARMMDAVPGADVVVTNPTHYSVALKYSADNPAPVVVAKGMDHVALKIRERAREAGVEVVPDPPLARSLHATVEVGQAIPEELYQGVAQLLAYVYRVAAKRRAVAGAAA